MLWRAFMKEWQKFTLLVIVFLAAYYIPFSNARVQDAIMEAFAMLQEYAREHILFCLVPAFFIAGAIAVFVNQAAVMKYFGAKAKKWLSYSVASISGAVLAVCSCTVLPLFAGIYSRGAGIGPATAFLYSGPAINVLAIILTARILGWRMGLARALGAVVFAFVVGGLMAVIFRKDELKREEATYAVMPEMESEERKGWQQLSYFLAMVLILIFAAWGKPEEPVGFWNAVYSIHWYLAGVFLLALIVMLVRWFQRDELRDWADSTWGFSKQILPLLFAGVIAAGFLMGRPESGAGIIPGKYISSLVGGNSLEANFLASIVGALTYFATLTEVPILEGLIGSGMGKGPALALLLAGPALSLPNILVIRSVIGTKKTLVFIGLVVIMATVTGMIFGAIT